MRRKVYFMATKKKIKIKAKSKKKFIDRTYKKKGKKNKRSSWSDTTKINALIPSKNLFIRREFLDIDYISKLSPKELVWFNKFMEEYNNAKLDKNKRKRINKGKRGASICYAINNKRNNDAYARSKAKNQLSYDFGYSLTASETEDDIIELLDKKREDDKDPIE